MARTNNRALNWSLVMIHRNGEQTFCCQWNDNKSQTVTYYKLCAKKQQNRVCENLMINCWGNKLVMDMAVNQLNFSKNSVYKSRGHNLEKNYNNVWYFSLGVSVPAPDINRCRTMAFTSRSKCRLYIFKFNDSCWFCECDAFTKTK